jgi:hypothetical protein
MVDSDQLDVCRRTVPIPYLHAGAPGDWNAKLSACTVPKIALPIGLLPSVALLS